ncbi:MAG: replication-associated recombination protein A [Gammaproteobacteria bacterium]|nr:replication-associated recombination protein A [Gammaproteobacteria bacterium]NIR99090.1 replication-associated recombination protein A [Gammaproteobacteria bacterium]NIT64722.1 replication-associated recombination protein A [Gammaproteobacteria bacterium]NIV21680.1 AAA family ATPase [Gammaproteobacteria bacterium]NIX10551.1 AAA family ATPase [Gammaproteobacteria bacterium]
MAQPAKQKDFRPLADRMRPRSLDELVGQGHLLGPDKPLRQALQAGNLHSMLFWGPPGTGKTTLARLIARLCEAEFLSISAVLSGVKEIRGAIDAAQKARMAQGRRTVLFVDEVHRFNKAQQDAFLPHVEDGTVTFIGATTENPSFELNNALLSRARVYVLKRLDAGEIRRIVDLALEDAERGLGARQLQIEPRQRDMIAEAADGDARRALNLLEVAADLAEAGDGGEVISDATVAEVVAEGLRRFDKGGEAFYEQISALHKSVRGSSPDAALYWLARMLDGGCDPLYIARRVVRMASEDIGNADPRALQLALSAWDVQERLGSPEGELAIAQAVVYLACAAKSNAVYTAFGAAMEEARARGSLEVPVHLRNAPTRLMKELGYGREYRYAHDEPEGYAAGERYFPEELGERKYYHPVARGLEIRIAEKLERLRALDREHEKKNKKKS